MSAHFFHKGISRLQSEELLITAGEDGSFLVRDSESVTGAYVLCLLCQKRVHQYRILPGKDGRISVQSEGDMQPPTYGDLHSLINSYINKGDKNGLVCGLKRAVTPEGCELVDADSEDDDFEEIRPQSEDRNSPQAKNSKSGLQNNFARLDLSSCDGEFVDALKTYLDEGLDKDAMTGSTEGRYNMPEFQNLLAIAGKGLQRELDVFLLKLSMCQDMLTSEDEDRKRTLTSNPADRLGSYINFLAAKLETCRSQILSLEKQAQEAIKQDQDDEYANPDDDQAEGPSESGQSFLPLALRRHSSVCIPLSTFEVKVLKNTGKTNYKLKLTVDIHQGRFFAVKPSKDLLDASNTFSHDKITQLVKNTTDNSRLHLIFDNKKKYIYQFENAILRENFCLQIRQMKSLHSEEEDIDNVSIYIGTWNMGKSSPVDSLKFWLKCSGEGKSKDRTLSRMPHDLYVIGTQESGMTEKDWINTIKAQLKAVLNVDIELLESCSLWGLRTLVFVNPKHKNKISHVQKSSVRTGIANTLGNKGAAAISFLLSGTSFCFINAHLASGEERLDRRNNNFRDILKGLNLGPKNLECYDVTHKFHHVFFFGDLNYRVTEPVEFVLRKLEWREYQPLLAQDQLKRCQFDKKAFFGFSESEISFMPTYRLERHVPGYRYDWKKIKTTGERINTPSWCDRILWHSYPGTFIENTAYGSVDNLLNSDHRPVFASFSVGVASPFIQNRASLQDNTTVKFIFKTIEAQIRTSTKQFYILEFSSPCLPDIICCESNKRFGESQKPGFNINPLWTLGQLPELRPLFSDIDYLEDQHLLIAVKGAGEDHESYGECVVSLKDMFSGETVSFESTMTHYGEETGKMKGEWYVSGGIQTRHLMKSKSSRKTYEIVALDTEYHDPEDFISLSPPVDFTNPGFFPAGNAPNLPPTQPTNPQSDEDHILPHYVNHNPNPARRVPSDPVPSIPNTAETTGLNCAPSLPSKQKKTKATVNSTSTTNPPVNPHPNTKLLKPMTNTNITVPNASSRSSQNGVGLPSENSLFSTSNSSNPSQSTSKQISALQSATSSSFITQAHSTQPQLSNQIRSDVISSPLTSKNQPLTQSATGSGDCHLVTAAAPLWPVEALSNMKPHVMPSAPPMPEPEIYPSIAIRPYEELKKPASVLEWLQGLGLSEYVSTFLQHGFDSVHSLSSMNAASVMKMGIRDAEHRLRILNSVQELTKGVY